MEEQKSGWTDLWLKEDYWAIWFGGLLTLFASSGIIEKVPKFGSWITNPLMAFPAYAFFPIEHAIVTFLLIIILSKMLIFKDNLIFALFCGITFILLFIFFSPLLLLYLGLAILTTIGMMAMKENWKQYLPGFTMIFIISSVSYVLANQSTMKAWGIGYAIWALGLGLLISNTIGTPKWLLAGARSEMFIKTGLVLLGAEILFSKILKLGGPGLIVAWMVTPTVIIFMWYFGTRFLKMTSKPFVIIVAAATSVCGVSAAIATAAACRAKKEELTLAVGMTMIFTVIMMVGMPALAKAIGLSPAVGGAWLGGTIDSTGAVVAAGQFFDMEAEKIAAVVKMIQNVLIGFVAFVVAVAWVTKVDRDPDAPRPSLMEIWYRFPKFILGFVLASVVFSFILMPLLGGDGVSSILNQTKVFRGWFFCLAFVSIGLESNFRDLAGQLVGGKPIILYIIGQSFNIFLTLFAAWLAFGGILFAEVI